jgi:hypothetical protein
VPTLENESGNPGLNSQQKPNVIPPSNNKGFPFTSAKNTEKIDPNNF